MERKWKTGAMLAACLLWAGSASAQMESAVQAAQMAQNGVEAEAGASSTEAPAPSAETPAEEAKEPTRDPFQPYGVVPTTANVASSDEGSETRQTLGSFPLDSFRLIGVIVSPDMALAAVQSRDAKDYIITTGDVIGKEGGVVETIRRDGMAVKLGENTVDIPVSNKVEKINAKDKK